MSRTTGVVVVNNVTKRILALDLANRTGWAYLGPDGRRLYGAWDIAARRLEQEVLFA